MKTKSTQSEIKTHHSIVFHLHNTKHHQKESHNSKTHLSLATDPSMASSKQCFISPPSNPTILLTPSPSSKLKFSSTSTNQPPLHLKLTSHPSSTLLRKRHTFTTMVSINNQNQNTSDDLVQFRPDLALINDDLRPTTPSERTFTWLELASLWIGLVVGVQVFILLGAWWMSTRTKYGISFPVLARSAFGIRGANVPTLLRALVGCGCSVWATEVAWLGTSVLEFACFIVFWLAQLTIVWRGIDGIRDLEKYSAPILIVLTCSFLIWAYVKAGGFGHMLSLSSRLSNREFWALFFPSLTANISFWATLALNIPDFTRYARSQTDQVIGQAGLPVFMGLFTFVGLAITSSTAVIFGRVISSPIQLLGEIGGLGTIILAIIGISLATITTNIAANVVAPANALVNLSPSKFTFRRGALLTALLGIAFQPWRLLKSSESFVYTWLVGYSALLGPIGGIILADYYLIRRMNLSLKDLYTLSPEGAYYYSGGYNLKAMVALVVGIVPVVPGLLNNVGILSSVPDLFVIIYNNACENTTRRRVDLREKLLAIGIASPAGEKSEADAVTTTDKGKAPATDDIGRMLRTAAMGVGLEGQGEGSEAKRGVSANVLAKVEQQFKQKIRISGLRKLLVREIGKGSAASVLPSDASSMKEFFGWEEKMLDVLSGGSWTFDNRPFILKTWSEIEDYKFDSVASLPVWDSIEYQDPYGNCYFQLVMYEWKLPKCTNCCNFGYMVEKCPEPNLEVMLEAMRRREVMEFKQKKNKEGIDDIDKECVEETPEVAVDEDLLVRVKQDVEDLCSIVPDTQKEMAIPEMTEDNRRPKEIAFDDPKRKTALADGFERFLSKSALKRAKQKEKRNSGGEDISTGINETDSGASSKQKEADHSPAVISWSSIPIRKSSFRYCNFWERMEDYHGKMMKRDFVNVTKGIDSRVDNLRIALGQAQKAAEANPNEAASYAY
ncbi:unnamed protein product [Rhodiola kirilowii]